MDNEFKNLQQIKNLVNIVSPINLIEKKFGEEYYQIEYNKCLENFGLQDYTKEYLELNKLQNLKSIILKL